jgi:hypothetical protein
MEEKRCFKCGIVKPLDEFYKHQRMSDGHLNKCKECTKKDSSKRYNSLIDNDSFLEKERIRRREKYIRLGMKKNNNKIICTPKRYKSYNGKVHHHWSYLHEHRGDCFLLDISCHSYIHKYIERTKDGVYWCFNGKILDSKDKHQDTIIKILTNRGRKCKVFYTDDGVHYTLVLEI